MAGPPAARVSALSAFAPSPSAANCRGDAVRQLITFIHEIAFLTEIEVKSVLCGGTRAASEVRLPYAVSYDVENGRISSLRLYFALDERCGRSVRRRRAGCVRRCNVRAGIAGRSG